MFQTNLTFIINHKSTSSLNVILALKPFFAKSQLLLGYFTTVNGFMLSKAS